MKYPPDAPPGIAKLRLSGFGRWFDSHVEVLGEDEQPCGQLGKLQSLDLHMGVGEETMATLRFGNGLELEWECDVQVKEWRYIGSAAPPLLGVDGEVEISPEEGG